MNNSRRHPLLRFILIFLIVSLPLVAIITVTNPHWSLQLSAGEDYPIPTPPGGGGGPVTTPDPSVPEACIICNCCDLKLTVPVPPAVGTGYDWMGVHYKVVANAGGETYLTPDPRNDKEPGGAPGYSTTPTPTPTGIPTGTGTVAAVALSANATNLTTCAQLEQAKTCLDTPPGTGCNAQYLNGTQFYLNSAGPATQRDTSGIQFSGVAAGYTWYLSSVYPAGGYSPYIFCGKTTLDPTYSMGESVLMQPGMTADFLVGFGSLYPWTQVKGGGNTFGGIILSLMPCMLTPTLLFDNTAAPTTPGIISSTVGVDFCDSWASPGVVNISSTNWNTSNGMAAKDWYAFFKNRLSQGTILSLAGGGKPTPPLGAAYAVYTTKDLPNGDLTINTSWDVGNGEKIIVLVEGSLNIQSRVTLTGNGFVAFIVKDNITVDGSVGTTWNSETPVVEGIYVAGGTLSTGTSTDPATERFVGKGSFIANNILLQRNLITPDENKTNSADLFLYNPNFLVITPSILQDLSYEWQEVAP